MDTASRLFMKYGLRSVTMNDLAKEAGVSKKTLYIHFRNKNDLVVKVFNYFIEDHLQCMTRINAEEGNAIDQWYQMMHQHLQDIGDLHPSLMYDMRKYHPEVWQLFNRHRNEHLLKLVEENLWKGITQGLYREDMDVEIVSRIYINLVPIILDDEIFPRTSYPFLKVHHELFLYNLLAIATEPGREYLLTRYKNPSSRRIQ